MKKKSKIKDVRLDGWQSALTGLGNMLTDKTQSMQYVTEGSIPDDTLERMFSEDDLAARIVGAIPDAAFRREISVKSDSVDDSVASPYEQEIYGVLDAIGAHEAQQDAATWGRLFGGGVAVISVDDGQAFSEPLVLSRVKALLSIDVFDKRDFQPIDHLTSQAPTEVYRLLSSGGIGGGYGVDIHRSRLMFYGGALTSRREKRKNHGWDHSVLLRCRQALRAFASDWQSASAMMADSSQGVLKIRDFVELLASGYKDQLQARLEIASLGRFVGKIMPIDSEEDFQYVERSFAGVGDLLDKSMYRLSAACGIPATVLFGRSPAGMNATGESDLTNWYDVVESNQRQKYGSNYDKLVKICAHAVGAPDPLSWYVEWAPLWTPSEKDLAETRRIYSEIDSAYIAAGVLDPDEIAATRFSGGWSQDAPVADMSVRGVKYEPRSNVDPPPEPEEISDVTRGDEGRRDASRSYVSETILVNLTALETAYNVSAPMQLIRDLAINAAQSLGIASVKVIGEINTWNYTLPNPTAKVLPDERSDSSTRIYAYDSGVTDFIMTDLYALEIFAKVSAPNIIMATLADRVASGLNIVDADAVAAIRSGSYMLRSQDKTLTVSVQVER